jgi:archaellin
MNKKMILVGAVVTLILLGFSGCLDEKSKFIGTWESEGGGTTLEFNDDNTVEISGDGPLDIVELTGNFDYSVGEDTVTFSSGSLGITLNYSFPESDELVLSNDQGNSMTFMKQ